MTPEEARELLDGTTYIPWEVESMTYQEVDCPEVTDFWIIGSDNLHVAKHEAVPNDYFEETQNDFMLIAAAPDMAATIANMTPEYCIEIQVKPSHPWKQVTRWHPGNPLRPVHTLDSNERIRTRYVTAPQPLGEEQ